MCVALQSVHIKRHFGEHGIEGSSKRFSTQLCYAQCDTRVKAIKYHRNSWDSKSLSCSLRASASSFRALLSSMNCRGACLMKEVARKELFLLLLITTTNDNKAIKQFSYVEYTRVLKRWEHWRSSSQGGAESFDFMRQFMGRTNDWLL